MRPPTRIPATPKIIRRNEIQDSFLQIYTVAIRTDDGLIIKLLRSAENYLLQIELSPKALERALAANPDFDVDNASYDLGRYDIYSDTLSTFPLTLASDSRHFLRPKYGRVRSIAFEGFGNVFVGDGDVSLEMKDLPLGFVRDMFAGFGVNYEYRLVVEELERTLNATAIVMCEDFDPSVTDGVVRLPYDTFDKWRRAMRRGQNVAVAFGNRSKAAYLRTQIAKELAPQGSRIASPSTDELADALAVALELPGRKRPLSAATDAVTSARGGSRNLGAREKSELLELNREIELLTLEQLIERLEGHLAKTHPESFWQKFFSENPFILRLAFGLPIAIYGEQVAVGGIRFDGTGGKIADYVIKAGHLGNLAMVEIKTPQTPIVESRPYRGDVHAPTKHLSGAVAQVLDQRYQLQLNINDRKIASGDFDVFSFSIQSLVIAGRDPTGSAERKSFEIYRNGQKDVTIVTFDELLAKLRALHAFLTQAEAEASALRQ